MLYTLTYTYNRHVYICTSEKAGYMYLMGTVTWYYITGVKSSIGSTELALSVRSVDRVRTPFHDILKL